MKIKTMPFDMAAPMLSNQFLELILFPTEQCNFRCTYCYEDFSIGRMHPNVIAGIKNLIKNRASELKMLKIVWFGGEPLSARDIVYDISQFSFDICNQSNIAFIGSMTTNGFVLNTNVARKLISYGIKHFQISLDGPKSIHDKTRLRINQTGSFETIWNNLLALKKSDMSFEVVIRIHLTPENYDFLPDLIDDIKFNFSKDQRFKLYFKAIANLGGPNQDSFKTLTGIEASQAEKNLQTLLDGQLDIVSIKNPNKPYVCYAAYGNSFVIRADGQVGKCTVALNSEKNSIGRITKDGILKIDGNKLQPWMRGIKNFDKKALCCPLNGIRI